MADIYLQLALLDSKCFLVCIYTCRRINPFLRRIYRERIRPLKNKWPTERRNDRQQRGGWGCHTSLDGDYTAYYQHRRVRFFFSAKVGTIIFRQIKREENICDVKYHVQDTTV